MSNDQRAKGDARRAEDSPAAWFAVLERARQVNDFELAARAQRELERLGVKVTYRTRRSQQAEGEGVEKAITPPKLARRWGVSQNKVMALIKSGELKAFDLSLSGTRPRYHINLVDVEAFEQSRSAVKPAAPKLIRTRRAPVGDVPRRY